MMVGLKFLKEFRCYQRCNKQKSLASLSFTITECSGILYVSLTIAGSRFGGLSARPWATMMCLGQKGARR
ncbi:hypothetical protein MKW98_011277 [Papaver atlanticum]|uniref:Uncharacterized protein n=1 Tax=Papaver atlanticum TaxID=357466 RepID=A0AAD4SVR7_9MAGN|nr:hypothetical protein MKW98_011277 [Papaver atlanticum]